MNHRHDVREPWCSQCSLAELRVAQADFLESYAHGNPTMTPETYDRLVSCLSSKLPKFDVLPSAAIVPWHPVSIKFVDDIAVPYCHLHIREWVKSGLWPVAGYRGERFQTLQDVREQQFKRNHFPLSRKPHWWEIDLGWEHE